MRRLVTRSISCSRCKQEVGPGAPWCPHCGRDLTEHSPLEVSRPIALERDHSVGAVGRALGVAALGSGLFVAIDVVLFATAPRVGLWIWAFVMVAVLFALSEILVPAGPAIRSQQGHLPMSAGGAARGDGVRTLPSPVQALVVSAPFVTGIAVVAFLERLVAL